VLLGASRAFPIIISEHGIEARAPSPVSDRSGPVEPPETSSPGRASEWDSGAHRSASSSQTAFTLDRLN
jgi:hypothetical protein